MDYKIAYLPTYLPTSSPPQVPFIGWAGPLLTPVLQRLSVPTASILFKRTGLQFFLEDPEASGGR